MKEAEVVLKLTKDHEVHKRHVTPIEAMLLVAEHHKNVGGNPIVVDEKTIKDTGHFDHQETLVDEDYVAVTKDGTGKETKSVATRQVKQYKTVWVPDKPERTEDDEIARLKTKYAPAKIQAMLQQVRNLPKDYNEAIKKGIELTVPSTKTFAEAKI